MYEIERNLKKNKRKCEEGCSFGFASKKTPHDKDAFKNARVLLLLLGASRKKSAEVELSKKAQQLISRTIS